MEKEEFINFLNLKNYDLRKTNNGRWIDQKCTPDVLWSISDFILNYVENVKETFNASDIWHSDYAKKTIKETFSKPDVDEKTAENEYDKVFSQPMCLLCYAGILEDLSSNKKHLYKVKEKNILDLIAKNDSNTLCFLQTYIEKVIKDSGLFGYFKMFFDNQTKTNFFKLKKIFIDFYHDNTKIEGDYEPKRIFTKVLNPLALKYNKLGSSRGNISKFIIKRADLMYNQVNFRDVYKDKPKNVTRKEWLEKNPDKQPKMGYFYQILNHEKNNLKNNIANYRNNLSELSQYGLAKDISKFIDKAPPTQIHHIFPKNEFPEILHYIENLIVLTPNQHYGFAHPKNNTQVIDYDAQKVLLISKICSIRQNLENKKEHIIYSFDNFLYVLSIGWSDEDVLNIPDRDYAEVLRVITCHYS